MTTRPQPPMRGARHAFALTLLIASTVVAAAEEVPQTGRRNGTLHGPSLRGGGSAIFKQFRVFALDCDPDDDTKPCRRGAPSHVVAGAGLRNAGHGTLRLRGVPAGAFLDAAYLYIGLIEDPSTLAGALPGLVFAGSEAVAAPLIAAGGRHCWEVSPGALLPGVATLYRAVVTPFLAPAINGDYEVFGVPSGTVDRSDPFACPFGTCNPILPLTQGVSLVVVYRHPDVPKSSVVYIHEARQQVPFLADNLLVEHDLLPAAAAGWRQARFSSLGGDGQTRDPDQTFQPLAPFSVHLALGADAAWIRGGNSEVEPNSDWIGLDGGTLPQLWDSRTTLIYRGELGAAQATPILDYAVHYQADADPSRDYDCVNPSVHVLELAAN